jgi:hypothetical protein
MSTMPLVVVNYYIIKGTVARDFNTSYFFFNRFYVLRPLLMSWKDVYL